MVPVDGPDEDGPADREGPPADADDRAVERSDRPADRGDPDRRGDPGDPDGSAGRDGAGTEDVHDRSRDRDQPDGAGRREETPNPDAGDPDRPSPEPTDDPDRGPVGSFLHSDDPTVEAVREVLSSAAMVAAVGLVLFAISGVWPPLVAVESGSMEPHMHKGDLVFVVESGRFSPGGDGVVTYREGTESGYTSFGAPGNVVVFDPGARGGTPIIHRAMFHVEAGENWVAMANRSHLGGISDCEQIETCPAERDGYVTKGDANDAYDQAVGRARVVPEDRIRGVAKVRVPLLGCIRLELSGNSCLG